MKNNITNNYGLNFLETLQIVFIVLKETLQIVFIVLKLIKAIKWSWLWVFSPTWISICLVLLIWIIYFIICKIV